jgi:DNA repair protein RadC
MKVKKSQDSDNRWIKNWPEEDRARELLLGKGPENVSDAGLIVNDVLDYLALLMRDLSEEFFKVIYLNKANIILAVNTLARRTVDEAIVYPREVIKSALDIGVNSGYFYLQSRER